MSTSKYYHSIRLSSTLALATTFYLVIETNKYLQIIIIFTSYMLTKVNSYIINTFSSKNGRNILKVYLFVISVLYNCIIIKMVETAGLSLAKSTIFIIASILTFQALSTNLDFVTTRRSLATISDIVSLVLPLLVCIHYTYNLSPKNIMLLFMLSLLTIFSFFNQIPFQVALSPYMMYVFSDLGAHIFSIFTYTVYLSYLYGYINALSHLENRHIIPEHTLRSLPLMTSSLFISLLLLNTIGLESLLIINGFITVAITTFVTIFIIKSPTNKLSYPHLA